MDKLNELKAKMNASKGKKTQAVDRDMASLSLSEHHHNF